MRKLTEIIDAALENRPASEEELRYALCAIQKLSMFDKMDLQSMATKEREGKSKVWAWLNFEESFNRWKLALDKSPKEWLGWNNDPQNPEYQQRRKIACRILDAALQGKLPNQQAQPGGRQ